ncbi:lysophospholipase, putative [Plasmodium chabaudi chabaudi]|uniref:Lysophospholipase, putative n=1 Tax=Plasmodium chabaudi chabaudi TaxID=31271 RepID=Q7YZ78_PLACU|nr:lysophospholipase, putative [Plasmodium chabaudi chabaudi]AAO06138.1 PC10113w [Plasmodium chabaudi chabaudi]VTZ68209.1 lysophospholipase, putative [Plasmodium chabaudi chabaudi]|eukprot:XP_741808.2 lysophospholipase, putative [Plasmodium chabaudi chabaudi]
MEEIELNNGELRSTTLSKLDGDPKTGWLCNKNGLLLKTYRWLADNAVGIILLIHGFRTHTRLAFMRINLRMPNNNEGLIVDTNNYYIYKDSWIEKFNQNGYSVYALDLQGHGESQSQKNVKGDFSSYDDLVDDVLQYMNQIQDEISNDNQMNDESYDILTTKKKNLPMYVIGYSIGGNIALRILQLLNKEKGNNINVGESDNNKKCNIMLDNSTNTNKIGKDMNNSNDYGSDNSCDSTSATTNAIVNASDKHEGCNNCLDKFNIKGCITISGMIRIKSRLDPGNKSLKYFYLPLANFLSFVLPHVRIFSKSYKKSDYAANVSKYDKFRNHSGIKFKYIAEIIKATTALDYNINYMPKDIPLLFVHSKDDRVCSYEWTALFHNKVKVDKKDLHPVDGMGHATTIEPGNEDILKKIIDWIYDLRRNDEDEIEDG